jgi:hypothetical protein
MRKLVHIFITVLVDKALNIKHGSIRIERLLVYTFICSKICLLTKVTYTDPNETNAIDHRGYASTKYNFLQTYTPCVIHLFGVIHIRKHLLMLNKRTLETYVTNAVKDFKKGFWYEK